MDTSEDPDALDGLVLAYLERVEAGEAPSAVLEALCAEHPEQSAALRRGVELLVETRLHPGPSGDGLPERIGPFRLLRRLGAGGMGVVYLAEQDAPRRRVALKLVRPDQLWFEGSRGRFRREVESAARMSHPGIAAVHEMGEHDGVPWFSQEYVVGAPLSDVLAGVPARSPESLTGRDLRAALADALAAAGEEQVTWDEEFFRGGWVEVCLRIGRQVADALQHAHERGVLHRDVKPSNVLLTTSGRCVLVDFGLASLRGADRLTRTGAQMGSLHYMPPEQVDGRREALGPRSDVYSLGVTLYELLTLRAPYASQSVERLRGMILEGAAPSARRANPAVSRDAAVIVACAMESEPDRRYATAAALAADLAAALAHRPIAARPAGPLRVAASWARRHPGTSVALVAGVLLFVVAPLVFAFERARAARDLGEALRSSEANFTSALDAVERVMRWTADEGLDDVPGVQDTRLRVVEEALGVFAELERERPDDPRLGPARARLERTRGLILRNRGRREEARAAFESAERSLAGREVTEDPEELHERGRSVFQRAQLAAEEFDAERAEALYAEAEALMRRVCELRPGSHGYRRDLAQTLTNRSIERAQLVGIDAGVRALRDEALAITRALLAEDPGEAMTWRVHSDVLRLRANLAERDEELEAAARDWEDSVAAIRRSVELAPRDQDAARDRVSTLQEAATFVATRLREPERALAWLAEALEHLDALVADNPDLPELIEERLQLLAAQANALRLAGRGAEGRARLEQVIEERRSLLDAGPATREQHQRLQLDLINLANFVTNERDNDARYDEVLELCDRAEALGEVASGDEHFARRLRGYLGHLRGNAWAGLGDADETLRVLEGFAALELDEPLMHYFQADVWAEWYALTGAERGREACLAHLEAAIAGGFADLALMEEGEVALWLDGDPRVAELLARAASR